MTGSTNKGAVFREFSKVSSSLAINGPFDLTSLAVDQVRGPEVSDVDEDIIANRLDRVHVVQVNGMTLPDAGFRNNNVGLRDRDVVDETPLPHDFAGFDIDLKHNCVDDPVVGSSTQRSQIGLGHIVGRGQDGVVLGNIVLVEIRTALGNGSVTLVQVHLRADGIDLLVGVIQDMDVTPANTDERLAANRGVVRENLLSIQGLHLEVGWAFGGRVSINQLTSVGHDEVRNLLGLANAGLGIGSEEDEALGELLTIGGDVQRRRGAIERLEGLVREGLSRVVHDLSAAGRAHLGGARVAERPVSESMMTAGGRERRLKAYKSRKRSKHRSRHLHKNDEVEIESGQ